MYLSVNGVDLSDYINPNTYSVNKEKNFDSWMDGNYKEHRIYKRGRIAGSFEVSLYGKNGMTTAQFLDTWNAAVDNEIVTATVFVQNTNETAEIQAFFHVEGSKHQTLDTGGTLDVLKVNIQER